ncbi:MAG: reverse transcriptase domain-containing protein [Anaerolineales bacterium]
MRPGLWQHRANINPAPPPLVHAANAPRWNVAAGPPPTRFTSPLMKTYSRLYPTLCSFENLYTAYCAARRGKRCLPPAAAFAREQEQELLQLQSELRSLTYQPGPYHSFYIHDPKRRLISAAPFRDRVVHHALIRVIEPIWERRFIFDTYANRVGKGTHRALDRCQQFARRFRYVLQCDLKQFFPSVDHALLLDTLARRLTDRPTLELCGRILASGIGVLSEAYDMVYFPADDLFAAERPRGLPIGNLTSQFWANVYLNGFDHFAQRDLKCAGYVRYVDDLLLFGNDKGQLWEWRAILIEQLVQLRLTLHEARAQVSPVAEGIPFLGFRVFPTHRRLKRRNALNFRRRLRDQWRGWAAGRVTFAQLGASVRGWVNHARYGNTYGLRRTVLRGIG